MVKLQTIRRIHISDFGTVVRCHVVWATRQAFGDQREIPSVRRNSVCIKRPLPGQVSWRRQNRVTRLWLPRAITWDRALSQGCIRQESEVIRQREQRYRQQRQVLVPIQQGDVISEQAIHRRRTPPPRRKRFCTQELQSRATSPGRTTYSETVHTPETRREFQKKTPLGSVPETSTQKRLWGHDGHRRRQIWWRRCHHSHRSGCRQRRHWRLQRL